MGPTVVVGSVDLGPMVVVGSVDLGPNQAAAAVAAAVVDNLEIVALRSRKGPSINTSGC